MPMAQPTIAVGVFDNRDQAERALHELERAGFRRDQVGFALRGGTQSANPAAPGAGGLANAAGQRAAGNIPGLGPVTTGGPLTGILGGAAAGALAGGLIGTLLGLGVPEGDARHFAQAFQAGRPLVLVKANGRVAEAADLLRRHGASADSNSFPAPSLREGSEG